MFGDGSNFSFYDNENKRHASWDLLNNPVQLGGPGHVVDETCVARSKPAANLVECLRAIRAR